MAYYGADPGHIGPFAARLPGQGLVGLAGADLRDAATATHEVWYVLRRDLWGRGIGGLVLAALLEKVRDRGGVRRLTATAVTSNAASWRLLEKHGFHREGISTGAHTKHGLTLDLYSYARDQTDVEVALAEGERDVGSAGCSPRRSDVRQHQLP